MEIDPEMYKLSRIDDAFHCQPFPGFEWWYFDAAFDNGYSMVTSWHIAGRLVETEPVPDPGGIAFAVYDPEGKRTATGAGFPASAVFASRETCDVKMGDNHLHGEFPNYEFHFRRGELGGDLFYENLTQGYRNPPDGITVLGQDPVRYMGHVIAQPRARVTGKLILAGKEIPINGEGYHDHNWGNVPLQDTLEWWYWGRIFIPNYTMVYAAVPGGGALMLFKGEKLLVSSPNLSAEPTNFEADALTGTKYPWKLSLKVDDPRVKGEIIHKLRKVVESPQQSQISASPLRYFRFLSDCDIKLVADGEKIKVFTEVIHELMTR